MKKITTLILAALFITGCTDPQRQVLKELQGEWYDRYSGQLVCTIKGKSIMVHNIYDNLIDFYDIDIPYNQSFSLRDFINLEPLEKRNRLTFNIPETDSYFLLDVNYFYDKETNDKINMIALEYHSDKNYFPIMNFINRLEDCINN
ncbi:MAG: hypothetical protein FWH41_08230 [Treponema sp.]|nr:hypothetical protein [Treponema sp.]